MDYSVMEMLPFEKEAVVDILSKYNLKMNDSLDYTAVLKHGSDIIGTCSFEGSVIKSFAIKPCYQSGNGTMKLLDHIVGQLFDRGIYDFFAYTKKDMVNHFMNMGFTLVHQTENVALVSYGNLKVKNWIEKTMTENGLDNKKSCGAIVMNGNPFTLGHRYLIEEAAKHEDSLIVFVVQENKSSFSFDMRFKMICEGTADLENVTVIPGGPFVVSQGTFPSYFTRDESEHAKFGAQLDAEIFSKYFAKSFNIVRRYVGTEPYCQTTGTYNQVLDQTLKNYGVQLKVIERKESLGSPISASRVREAIQIDQIHLLKDLLPETTLKILDEADVLSEIGIQIGNHH